MDAVYQVTVRIYMSKVKSVVLVAKDLSARLVSIADVETKRISPPQRCGKIKFLECLCVFSMWRGGELEANNCHLPDAERHRDEKGDIFQTSYLGNHFPQQKYYFKIGGCRSRFLFV
ncbi:hypothetical protein CEXT_532951 [Caerostris extrusa]|uniref:Uncharacterized protein n=1 Tax=Caerostris extrusa TaxID=172846 RepID=A0AAV4PP94_CAEEX|nr:hypothetical protein CEXT_532951 [Caerostris extrusa]